MRTILALLFALISAPASAQVGQLAPGTVMGNAGSGQSLPAGTDIASVLTQWGVPLPGTVGGTNNAFMQFSGPASTLKTYTLPNASDTIATLTATQTLSNKTITGGSITGLPSPSNASDAATKAYVDANASGLTILAPSRLATAAVLPNTPTYANGASGVGATLTAGANSTLTVDGTIANLNDVVLVQTQASAFQNGLYTVTNAGSGAAAWVLTRATYFDQAAEMKSGSYTQITAGSTNINKSYVLAASVTTVGTDALNFNLFSSAASNLTIGSTSISGGTTTRIPYDNAGILGEYSITGTGTVVAMQTSPTILGHPTVEGITSTGATGTGAFMFSASPTTTGTLGTAASSSGGPSILVPHGAAPTSPANGAFWSTTAGFFGQVNGATVGPFGPTGVSTCTMSSVSINTSVSSTFCQTVLVDASGGARTITLYAPSSGVSGFSVDVKKIDSSANNVIVVVNGAGAIDGGTSVAIGTQWSSARFQANSSQWYLL